MAKKFELKALITGVDKLSPTLKKARENAMGFRRKLLQSGLGKPISLQGILRGGALAAPFVAGAKSAIDFESSMADVRKVVKFDTPEQFKEMSDDILDMSKRMPMAAKEIASIFAAGGQSNIAREELAAFAEDAVKMGVAFNTTADEAGDTMAKWRAAFKFNQEEVAELADQVNELGNKGAASAGQISKIVTAIGPLGEIAGVSSSEIAALGATLAGVGVDESVASTSMSRFFTTLNAGASATKAQQNVLKALRMDPKTIAEGMTTDAKGTMMHVLKAISKVDESKQVAVMKQLFGDTGMKAVAPLLTSLDTLQTNFDLVADKTQYAGSMQREYEARSATTANAIQLFRNRITATGIAIGSALLPGINNFLTMAGPMIDMVTRLVDANPWLIKGILGAAGAFVAIRLAVWGAAKAMQVFASVSKLSPIGIAIRLLTFAAGFLIANWDKVAPYFEALWEKIREPAMALWNWLKNVFFNWTPFGLIIQNWGAISQWFVDLWNTVKGPAQALWDWYKNAFFKWNPLGIIIENWEPIVQWFKSLWDRVQKFIEPILNGMDKVRAVTTGIGDTVSGAASAAKEKVTGAASRAWGGIKGLFGSEDGQAPLAPAPLNQKSQLNGELDINITSEGRVTANMKTDQPGLDVRQNVGYRSLAGAH